MVSGGTGLIGKQLAPMLKREGLRLHLLSRKSEPVEPWDAVFQWDPDAGAMDMKAFEGVTHIINLAGASIAGGRWTKARKKEITDSRVKSIALLEKGILEAGIRPEAFISSSAIGWYGAYNGRGVHTEAVPAANDFLGTVCSLWEKAAAEAGKLCNRTVTIRTGLVLSGDGGALPVMAMPVKMFVGSPVAPGIQQMPWIHISDICRVYLEAIKNTGMSGAYNAVAVEGISNKDFYRELAGVLHRPLWPVQVPEFVMKAILGKLHVLVTRGSRVSNSRLLELGFQFRFTDLKAALSNLLGEQKKPG